MPVAIGRVSSISRGMKCYLELSDDIHLVSIALAVGEMKRRTEVDEIIERLHFLQRHRKNLWQ